MQVPVLNIIIHGMFINLIFKIIYFIVTLVEMNCKLWNVSISKHYFFLK